MCYTAYHQPSFPNPTPFRLLINIVGLCSKADACTWIWEYSDAGTCLYVPLPTWWCVFGSAVSRTVTDARWKHTWSLRYVLLIEVLWHPARPRHKAATLKIKAHMCLCAHANRDKGVRYHGSSSALDVSACVRVDTKENNTYAETHAHKAGSDCILPQ